MFFVIPCKPVYIKCFYDSQFHALEESTGIMEFGFALSGAAESWDIITQIMEQLAEYFGILFYRIDNRNTKKYGPKCFDCGSPHHWSKECKKGKSCTYITITVDPSKAPALLEMTPAIIRRETEKICQNVVGRTKQQQQHLSDPRWK